MTIRLLCLLTLGTALACESQATAPPVPRSDGGSDDDDPVDAGTDADAAARDAGAERDGGSDRDVANCTPSDPITIGTSENPRAQPLAIAGHLTDVLVWSARVEGRDDLFARRVTEIGRSSEAPIRLTDDVAVEREPTLEAIGTALVAAYISNASGSYELYTLRLDSSGRPTSEPRRITSNESAEYAPALARNREALLLSWIEDSPVDGRKTLRIVPLDASGEPTAEPVALTRPGAALQSPSLASLGTGVAAIYASNDELRPVIYLQLATAGGIPRGEPEIISTEPNVHGRTSFVSSPCAICEGSVQESGGAVFGVLLSGALPVVRYRRVGTDGLVRGPERTVNTPLENALDPAIAAFRGRWIVTYYSTTYAKPRIRGAIVDAAGEATQRFDIAEVVSTAGPSIVRDGRDGSPIVAFSEMTDEGIAYRMVRIECE